MSSMTLRNACISCSWNPTIRTAYSNCSVVTTHRSQQWTTTGQAAMPSYNLPRDQTTQRLSDRVRLHLQHQALPARGRAALLEQRHDQKKLELAPSVVVSAVHLAPLSMLTCCERATRRPSFCMRVCQCQGYAVSNKAQATCSMTGCGRVTSAGSHSALLHGLHVLQELN